MLFVKIILLLMIVVLNGCISMPDRSHTITHTKDSGPSTPVDVSQIPEPTPHPVIRTAAGNKSPYVVLGKRYTVLADSRGFRQRGNASWYGTKFHGRRTSNGEIYNMYAMTAAHKTLPIPSYVKVTNLNNQRNVIVRVNDRGPFHGDRIIDLSYAAAKKLGYVKAGVTPVMVEDVTPTADSQQMATADKNANSSPAEISTNIDNEHSLLTSSTPAYLQVGAFRERQSAEKLRAKLMSIVSYPVAVAHSQDTWYRVRIGPIYTAQSIAYLRHDLASQGHAKLYVVYE